jgi:transketolase
MDPARIRQIVLEQSKRANVGHIGSGLCVADLLAALYGGVLRQAAPSAADRDRFILSKGHAALALYAALHLRGWLSAEELNTYCGDGTLLGVHPERELPGVDFSTGSLGHGLSIGAGAALAARMQGSRRRIFVLLSDAECNEGSVWEAVMFAAQQRLGNLVALIDVNRQQAFGYTEHVINLDPLGQRWASFGWEVREVDGHDIGQISASLSTLPEGPGAPKVLVANTIFGRGVSFMERQIKWHYLPMSDAQFEQAMAEVGAAA